MPTARVLDFSRNGVLKSDRSIVNGGISQPSTALSLSLSLSLFWVGYQLNLLKVLPLCHFLGFVMAQHSQAPKFGNWESEENVSYTEYFENKRKRKGGGRKNLNGPQDNTPPVQAPPQQEAELKGQMASKHEPRTSHEDVKIRRLTDSPLHIDTVGQTSAVDSPNHRHGGTSPGETPKRVTRKSAGSDRSIDHSPLHPHYQAGVRRKISGVSSPSLEKKGSSEGSHGLSPSTPGRSRLRSVTRGDNTADHSPVVPKFGDWDESDPTSAERYSHIFNKVREEKQIGEGKVPGIATETSNSTGQKQHGNDNSKSCCCFPWGRR